jgi:hypothetical protein
MTEREWEECTDPTPALDFLYGCASARQLRFFALACCRRVGNLIRAEAGRHALELAERHAEAVSWKPEVMEAAAVPVADCAGRAATCAADAFCADEPGAVLIAAADAAFYAAEALGASAWETERAAQCRLLREVVGSPFHQVAVDPAWLARNGGTVRRLAAAIADTLTFDRLPALALALERAGCRDAVLLAHCRGRAEHVRGCWAVELLRGAAPSWSVALPTQRILSSGIGTALPRR